MLRQAQPQDLMKWHGVGVRDFETKQSYSVTHMSCRRDTELNLRHDVQLGTLEHREVGCAYRCHTCVA